MSSPVFDLTVMMMCMRGPLFSGRKRTLSYDCMNVKPPLVRANLSKNIHFLFAVFPLLFAGCAEYKPVTRVYTPDEKAYLSRAMATPQDVDIEKAQAEDAWGRAQSFVGRFSDLKIQTVSNYIIETYNPSSAPVRIGDNFIDVPSGKCGFHVVKTPMGEKVRISGKAICESFGEKFTRYSALFRYYVLTGDEPPPGVFIAPSDPSASTSASVPRTDPQKELLTQ